MGGVHASASRHNGGVVIAVADTMESRGAALAKSLHAKSLSLDAILERNRADVLHVCTPPSSHREITLRALQAGMHVICEKPVTDSATELAELLLAARERGLLVCPVHQFPFQRGAIRAIARRASLGTIRHGVAEMFTAGADAGSGYDRRQLALDIISHPLSLSRAFGAEPLAEVRWSVAAAEPGELTITGVSAHAVLTYVVSTRGRPTSNTFRAIGDSGTATLDLYHGYAYIEHLAASRASKVIRPFAASALQFGGALANGVHRLVNGEASFPGLRELVSRCYRAILHGMPGPVTFEDALDVAAARDAISAAMPAGAESLVR